MIFQWIETGVGIFLSLLIPFFFIYRLRKNRRLKQELQRRPEENEPIEGTLEDLEDAESALKREPADIRIKILDTHVLYGRYSTFKGYTRPYMETLIRYLEERGVRATYVFQQSLPLGAASFTEPHGVFELYVYESHEEEADRYIKEFFAS